jgi:hypothetical protein
MVEFGAELVTKEVVAPRVASSVNFGAKKRKRGSSPGFFHLFDHYCAFLNGATLDILGTVSLREPELT